MCIIAYKPSGVSIGIKRLEACFDNNPDGAGFMVWNGTEVIVKKGFFSFEMFYEAYKQHVTSLDEAVLHFRIMTCGNINKKNTHPHDCGKGAYMVHNGHFNFGGVSKGNISDSIMFARSLKQFSYGWWNSEDACSLIDFAVGSYNKVVVMAPDGEVVVFNEEAGKWDSGVWYSNTTYKVAMDYDFYGNKQLGYGPHGWSEANTNWHVRNGKWERDEPVGDIIYDDDTIGMCSQCYNDITAKDWEDLACMYCGADLNASLIVTSSGNGVACGEDDMENTCDTSNTNDAVKKYPIVRTALAKTESK